MGRKRKNFGQEIILNDWQIGSQNLIRLLLLSMGVGLLVAFICFSLFAPKNLLWSVALYFYSWLYLHFPFAPPEIASQNIRLYQPIMDYLGNLFRVCGTIFAFVSVVAVFALRRYFVKRGEELVKEQYIRGAKLLKAEELKAEINSHPKLEETPFDLWLGIEKIRLPAELTYRHLAMAGVSGVGKTQAISSILKQLAQMRRQKCLIVDLNGQYYSKFGRPGDKVISLYDRRTEAWSFWNENAPAEFFAEALVELNEGSGNKFFSSAGRALMTDLLNRNSEVKGLWKDLTTKPVELLPKLEGGISPGLLGAPEQASGVIASASVELNFLRHLNYWNQSEDFFSITDWTLNQSEEWVFLVVKDIDLAAVKPLMRLWFSLAVGGALQREENGDYPHLWMVCDELPGLGQLPSLGKLLSQGRKYRSTVIAGYQVQGQIRSLYGGKDGAEEIFSGLQNKLIFRTIDPGATKEESATLGEQEVEEITTSTQFGTSPMSDRNSLNRSIKTRPVVLPSELQILPDLHAYVKLREFNVTRIRFEPQKYPEINEAALREIPPNPKLGVTKPSDATDDWESEAVEVGKDVEVATRRWDVNPKTDKDRDDFVNFGED